MDRASECGGTIVNKNAPKSEDPDHYFAPASTPSNTDYRHARSRNPISIESSQPSRIPTIRNAQGAPESAIRKIVVVGVCSSGKSTLVSALCDRGYHASAVSQEHSYVPHLWQRSNPDVLIYLDASLHTIRGRGRTRWRQSLLDEEHRRLQHAREHCHIYVPTDGLSPQDVVSRVVTFLMKLEIRS
jgi:dienelactone hydrolase